MYICIKQEILLMEEQEKKECFVIMPISDADGYNEGHFTKVYEHLIKPACKLADYKALRADEVNVTNIIALNIMEHICAAPIAICDVSNCNPNVFYELGIRHATLLPVVLIKDSETDDPFDIKGIRYIQYDKGLSVDDIMAKQVELSKVINSTMAEYNSGKCQNSLFHLIKNTQTKGNDSVKAMESNTTFIKKEVERISNMIDTDNSSFIGFDKNNIGAMITQLWMLCDNSRDLQLYEYIKAKYKCKYPHSFIL